MTCGQHGEVWNVLSVNHLDIRFGEALTREMIDVLRPATPGAISPADIDAVIGTHALADIPMGKELRWTDLG